MDEEWRRLDPRSVRHGRQGGAIVTALIGGPAFTVATVVAFAGRFPGVMRALIVLAALGFVAALGAIGWIVPERAYRHTRYRLDELGMVILRGRVFHRQIGVLRTRIQHTDVSQGPLQRAHGVGTLTIHTAGQEAAKIQLAGIAFDEAQRLRAELTGLTIDDVV